jgi:hypothetical protein
MREPILPPFSGRLAVEVVSSPLLEITLHAVVRPLRTSACNRGAKSDTPEDHSLSNFLYTTHLHQVKPPHKPSSKDEPYILCLREK